MITVEVKEKSESSYPCLKSYGKLIVLFSGPDTGTLLQKDGVHSFEIGRYSKTWCEERFVPYYGQVIVANSP